jgi:hypothetical protein
MKARVWTKPRCDEYTASSGLAAREIFTNCSAPLPKVILIDRTKDECMRGFVFNGDLTDYIMHEQLRQNWSPGTRCEGVARP